MPKHLAVRALATIAIVVAAATGSVITATSSSALSPCASYTPPDWCFDPPAAPAAPTGLKATAILQTSVTLSWNAPGTLPLTLTTTVNGQTATTSLKGGSSTYTDGTVPAGATISYALWATACNLQRLYRRRAREPDRDHPPAQHQPGRLGIGIGHELLRRPHQRR